MVKVAQVGQHVFYGFGGHRGAIDAAMVARNSTASQIVAAAPKAAPTSDKPVDAPAPPTTVAITAPAASTVVAAASAS
jgi:hypothetical protein